MEWNLHGRVKHQSRLSEIGIIQTGFVSGNCIKFPTAISSPKKPEPWPT